MNSIAEVPYEVQLNKENNTFDKASSPMASPSRPLRGKKSLSILSANEISRRSIQTESSRPVSQRIISESTGLVKFSLRSTAAETTQEEPQKKQQDHQLDSTKRSGLPIYIPVDSPERVAHPEHLMSPFLSPQHKQTSSLELMNPEEELLFKYAKKQREVMELKSKLEQAEKDLKNLESQLVKKTHIDAEPPLGAVDATHPKLLNMNAAVNPVTEFKKLLAETSKKRTEKIEAKSPVKDGFRAKIGKLNFPIVPTTSSNGEEKPVHRTLNRQESILKLKQDFSELSNNIRSDSRVFQTELLAKSRNFINSLPSFTQPDFNFNTAFDKRAPQENIEEENEDDKTEDRDFKSLKSKEVGYDEDESDDVEDLEGGSVTAYEI